MNHDLRHSLRALADTGADHTMPHEILTEHVLHRAGRARRRRPVIIAGLTTAGVLTAGAAAALGITYLTQDDGPAVPDRITPGIESPAPQQPEPQSALSPLQCGDMAGDPGDTGAADLWLTAPSEYGDPHVRGDLVLDGAGALLPVSVSNAGTGDVSLTITENVGLYLVSGGFIVAVPDGVAAGGVPGISTDLTLGPDGSTELPTDGLTWCDPERPGLPGEYEALARVDVTLDDAPDAPVTVTGGPWFVVVPSDPGDGGGDTDAGGSGGLAGPDPAASAPQCGATIATDGTDAIEVATDADLTTLPVTPEGATVPVTAWNVSESDQESSFGEVPLVVVRDGIVVGSAPPPTGGGTRTLGVFQTTELTGRLILSACRPGEQSTVPLPEGRYEVWAASTWGTATSTNRVAHLWIDADGEPTANPAAAAGWPRAIEPSYAMTHPGAGASIVWLSESEDATALAALDELGYGAEPIPGYCQPGLIDSIPTFPLNDLGVGVIFASPQDAATFADLYDGPIVGVVDREVSCVFDWG